MQIIHFLNLHTTESLGPQCDNRRHTDCTDNWSLDWVRTVLEVRTKLLLLVVPESEFLTRKGCHHQLLLNLLGTHHVLSSESVAAEFEFQYRSTVHSLCYPATGTQFDVTCVRIVDF